MYRNAKSIRQTTFVHKTTFELSLYVTHFVIFHRLPPKPTSRIQNPLSRTLSRTYLHFASLY
jgi:hypothetical protein